MKSDGSILPEAAVKREILSAARRGGPFSVILPGKIHAQARYTNGG
jgi:hypothetical protein